MLGRRVAVGPARQQWSRTLMVFFSNSTSPQHLHSLLPLNLHPTTHLISITSDAPLPPEHDSPSL